MGPGGEALLGRAPPPDGPAGSRHRSRPASQLPPLRYRSGNDLHARLHEVQIPEHTIHRPDAERPGGPGDFGNGNPAGTRIGSGKQGDKIKERVMLRLRSASLSMTTNISL